MNRSNTLSSFFMREETKSTEPSELSTWENLRCEAHPNLKIDVLCVNDAEDEIKLLCIKCIINAHNYDVSKGDKLIAIKEVVQKCAETINADQSKMSKSKDDLHDKFLDYSTKNYIGTFEQHIDSQLSMVDQEVDDMIKKLQDLKKKYKQFYTKELEQLKAKNEEVKEKMKAFLDEDAHHDSFRLTSVQDIYDQLANVVTKEELLTLMKHLYHRSKERVDATCDTTNYQTTINLMDEIKDKISRMRSFEFDISKLKELNHHIDNLLKSDLNTKPNEVKLNLLPQSDFMFPEPHREFSEDTFSMPFNSLDKDPHEFTPTQTVNKAMISSDALRNFENFAPTEKKRRRTRYTEIESHSLRNLTKAYENTKENDDETKEKAITRLNDWINRRITGYLIFQNTMNSMPSEQNEKTNYRGTVHLNQIMGKKWKQLKTEEKEEYLELAKKFRKAFREEIEQYENYDDITDLVEKLDQKIKKIKKE